MLEMVGITLSVDRSRPMLSKFKAEKIVPLGHYNSVPYLWLREYVSTSLCQLDNKKCTM